MMKEGFDVNKAYPTEIKGGKSKWFIILFYITKIFFY